MSKYCPNCGEKIPRRAGFCPNCGYSFVNNMSHFQNQSFRATRGNYSPQPTYGGYAGYYPAHRFRRWSFKVISVIIILMMIFCYVVFHMLYRHTVPNDMKGTTVSGTKMLAAPAKNHSNNRRNPNVVLEDYSPTEYFYDEAFFGEYGEGETDFYQSYDSDNQFNYNTVNNASDTITDTTKKQNNKVSTNNSTNTKNNTTTDNKSSNNSNKSNDSNKVAKNAKNKAFMSSTPTTSSSDHKKSSSDTNTSNGSDNSSDNLNSSDNNSDSTNSDSSDSSSSDNSDSSDSSSSDNSDSSDSSNSDSSDSSNNSDSDSSSSDGDSSNGSDSDQSYHPDDHVYLDPLDDGNSSSNSGHKVNVQLSYTINPHTINVIMRMGKVQRNVTYHINHVYRYSNDKVEFYVSGVGKYAKYHEFTFTEGSNNQYTIYAVNGSHASAQYFNNGELNISKAK